MECEICKKGLDDGISLFRINEKGVDGVWRCRKDMDIIQKTRHREDIRLDDVLNPTELQGGSDGEA